MGNPRISGPGDSPLSDLLRETAAASDCWSYTGTRATAELTARGTDASSGTDTYTPDQNLPCGQISYRANRARSSRGGACEAAGGDPSEASNVDGDLGAPEIIALPLFLPPSLPVSLPPSLPLSPSTSPPLTSTKSKRRRERRPPRRRRGCPLPRPPLLGFRV